MSSPKREINKDVTNFNRLCKDLFKFIKRKIMNKYVRPESKIDNLEEEQELWKYYNTEEVITEEDKIYNIYKDSSFLLEVQICYRSLSKIISILDENRKNYDYLKKSIEVGEKKIKLLSELNSQLNKYFNSSNEKIPLNQSQNNLKNFNDKNVLDHLSLMKSFNILNDLNIMNSLKDLNNGENIINNNNTINNNNAKKENAKSQKSKHKKAYDSNFLNKKRENNERYIEINNHKYRKTFDSFHPGSKKESYVSNTSISKTSKNNIRSDKKEGLNNITSIIQNNETEKNEIISLIDKINLPEIKSPAKENNEAQINTTVKENYINLNITNINSTPSNSEKVQKQYNSNIKNNGFTSSNSNNKSLNKSSNGNNLKYKDNGEIEFEKALKNEFPSIYSNEKLLDSNNDIILEIKNILQKISQIDFPKRGNKFDNPYLIGTYKNVDIIYLLDTLPAIDILFKCKDIKNISEIQSISAETMSQKLSLSYIEICSTYDKENEIVKVINKCKIKVKDNYFFIYIDLFYVNVNISVYTDKERCINNYLFSNEIYSNKDKLLICLFLRRWRRKFKLFFIAPEFLDIIINFYYNEKESISLIIENIFYDLINGDIHLKGKNNVVDEEKNIKEIKDFISEWYTIPEYKTALNSAIVTTNESLLKNDFLSVIKSE